MDANLEMKDGGYEQSTSTFSDFHFFLDFDEELRTTRRMRMRMTHNHGLMPSRGGQKDSLWPLIQLEDIPQTSSSKTLMGRIDERSSNSSTKPKLEGDSSAPALFPSHSPANNIIISTSSILNQDATQFPEPLPQQERQGICMKRRGGDKGGGGGEEERENPIMIVVESEEEVLYDGYSWRKYGEKNIKNRIYPRSYYRCGEDGCKIKKHVERSTQNPSNVQITYFGHHNHPAQFYSSKIYHQL